ncbi:Cupin 2 conserved barrel domain protein [Beutenbergia cavernae DSM 12333]|uniref:Cupin 2 conserved barrel domain protein n=1 Tax=Beutenbergia cavernae (strain ATCC BAA-8 / DSM 12333 / CCUG 43141 / JCM 11478 / NBRC 16432 / NCIMB 13614 / HKI 0122) TaxID=471853 RepID=C5BXG7_BEUC1|nr:cupin domain-containing protein [Beutenbergia cavernae]ACQ80850.1 Cupin 2 conserved barrel domain protein [Beutenbergia cavernae DSM 12333]
MRRFEVPRRPIEHYSSTGVLMEFLPRVSGGDQTRVHVAHLEPGGTLGEHPTTNRQVFAVVTGEGEVRADDGPRIPIAAGQLAIWEAGEVHQSWATTAMTVVLVETTGELELPEVFTPLDG